MFKHPGSFIVLSEDLCTVERLNTPAVLLLLSEDLLQ